MSHHCLSLQMKWRTKKVWQTKRIDRTVLIQQTTVFYLPSRLHRVSVSAGSGDLWGKTLWVFECRLFSPNRASSAVLAICGWSDPGSLACIHLPVCSMTYFLPLLLCVGSTGTQLTMRTCVCVFSRRASFVLILTSPSPLLLDKKRAQTVKPSENRGT